MWATLIPMIMNMLGKNSPGMQKINSAMSVANAIKSSIKTPKEKDL